MWLSTSYDTEPQIYLVLSITPVFQPVYTAALLFFNSA